MNISECCVMLHNLIVKLDKNGMLTGGDCKRGLDIVREFEGKVQNMHADGATYTAAGNNGDNLHLHMDKIHVAEAAMTREYENWRLREDLIHVYSV